jgi:hypothetical protein
MTSLEKNLFTTANLLVGGTGLGYGWFRYFVTSDDPYAVVNHPDQPLWQHLHIWLAPLLVLAVGHFLYQHALLYWKAGIKEGRRSGLLMLALALPMIFSGYLLQTAVDETWRQAWIIVHVAASLLWLVGVIVHLLTHYTSRRTLLEG